MEKFMLLFRGSDVYQPGEAPETVEALKYKMIAWLSNLVARGIHVGSEPLQTTGKQVNGTKKIVTDGPFGTGGEVIGGCTIVQAKDIDEAVEIAKSCPIVATNANIEIRPIQKIEM
jgi:hypothetical protein